MAPFDTSTPSPGSDIPPPDIDARVAAFLATIRQFESNGDYSALVGGGSFADFSQHPNRLVTLTINGRQVKSTAAGAYQFIFPTWSRLASRLGLSDFTPESQDAAALELIKEIGAYTALANNDLQTAFHLAASQWASLPGSTAGQNPQSMQVAMAAYNDNIG